MNLYHSQRSLKRKIKHRNTDLIGLYRNHIYANEHIRREDIILFACELSITECELCVECIELRFTVPLTKEWLASQRVSYFYDYQDFEYGLWELHKDGQIHKKFKSFNEVNETLFI